MRKRIALGLIFILLISTFAIVSFGESVEANQDYIRVGMILNSSNTLLEGAVVGNGMGEYTQESIDIYSDIVDEYYDVSEDNPSEKELNEVMDALIEGYRVFTGSRNAVQEDLDRYNDYLDDAIDLLEGKTIGVEVGNLSQANYDDMKAYFDSQEKYEEGTIVTLGEVRAKDETLSMNIRSYIVAITEDDIIEPVIVEEPVVEEPIVEDPIPVVEELLPVVEEPVVKEEEIPETIIDIVETTPENQTPEQLETINEEIILLINSAEQITNLSDDIEASKQLFEEIIVPIGDHYNKIDNEALTSIELMNESIELANVTIALSGEVALDGQSLDIQEDEVKVEPSPEALLAAVEKTENAEKAVEGLMAKHMDEGLEDAVVSTVNIKVPETLSKIAKTKVNITKDAVNLLSESSVEKVNLDMGTVNFGINDKFLDKHQDTSLQFAVDKLLPVETNDPEDLPKDVTPVDSPVYDLAADQNEQRGDLFKHPVNLTFELDSIKEELSANETYVVSRFNESTETWELVSGFYDPVSNTISVSRLHLSKYTVMKTEKNFTNIEDSWAKNEIATLRSNGVIKEVELFRPDDAISREEFASWITTAYGLDAETLSSEFSDIDENNEYFDEISIAFEHGIISGYPDGTFDPKGDITKEEMASMIASAMDSYEYTVDTETFNLAQYEEDLPQWAVTSVETVVENGLVEESYFGSADIVTKEEAASILYNVYR